MHALIRKSVLTASSLPLFFARNLWCGRKLAPFPVVRYRAFVVEPLSRKRLAAVDDLYASINAGERLGFPKKALLWLLGPRLCLVACDDRNDLVAMTLFYFNARDWREDTVHASYNGLRESAQGAGLGTFLLQHALESFARSGLAGASSRVSLNNLAALKTNQKAGFVPVETYFDPLMDEERHYLVCDLRRYKKSIDKPERKLCG
jgi:GNAT superfamily N-acetyltransferase